MPIMFEGAAGRVTALDDPGVQGSIALAGLTPAMDFQRQRSIITRITVSQQVNLQFLHTIGALVYVYVFGDRMGSINLSGLSFAADCPGQTQLGGVHGAELLYAWYRQNKASSRQAACRVMVGRVPFDGFVTDFTADVVEPATLLVQWGMALRVLPER